MYKIEVEVSFNLYVSDTAICRSRKMLGTYYVDDMYTYFMQASFIRYVGISLIKKERLRKIHFRMNRATFFYFLTTCLDNVLGTDRFVTHYSSDSFGKHIGNAQLLHLVALLRIRNTVCKYHFGKTRLLHTE